MLESMGAPPRLARYPSRVDGGRLLLAVAAHVLVKAIGAWDARTFYILLPVLRALDVRVLLARRDEDPWDCLRSNRDLFQDASLVDT